MGSPSPTATRMVRNLRIMNARALRPMRGPRKRLGPRESSRTRRAIASNAGRRTARATAAAVTSKARFSIVGAERRTTGLTAARIVAETRRPSGSRPGFVHRPALPRVSTAVAMVGLLALIALTFRPVVEGDGVGYYAYLHAILVSHSLRLSNEYSAAVSSHVPVYLPLVTTKTSTGRLADYFPIGSAVMAAPAYLVALWLRPSGEPQYGSPFVEAFTLASLAYGLMGLAISYRLASSVTGNRRAALVGVAGATVATPAVYYLLSDPSYSQTFSVFCVSAFLYLWFAHPPHSAKGWFGLGVLGGIMAMTRFQD